MRSYKQVGAACKTSLCCSEEEGCDHCMAARVAHIRVSQLLITKHASAIKTRIHKDQFFLLKNHLPLKIEGDDFSIT